MTAFWPPDPGYDPGPDAVELTGWGDRQRTFLLPDETVIAWTERDGQGIREPQLILRGRDPLPAELAEFRVRFFREMDEQDDRIAAGVPVPPVTGAPASPDPAEEILAAIRDASPAACAGCGRDDLFPGEDGRCKYCAGLAALRVRKLSAWWFLVPHVLGLLLSLAVVWALLHVALYGYG